MDGLMLGLAGAALAAGLAGTGSALGTAVKAVATVTFAAVKKGFVVCPDAANYTGEIYVASIGVEPTILYSSRRR